MLNSWIPAVVGAFIIWSASVAHYMFELRPRANSHGFTAKGWRPVAKVFREQIESGELKGGGLSVYHNGELVVELFGGQADPHNNMEWERDTLTQAYSTTKGVAAIVMAMLVDRDLISYYEPVSKYWPEFAAQGKGSITVEQLLSHQAGLPIINQEFSLYDVLTDPRMVGQILAGQKPIWKPGTQHGYHGITFGLYVDQLVRRIDPYKRDLSTFFHQEIAVPFGIDFFIGLPKEENYRCARAFDFSFFSTDILFASRYYSIMYAYATDKDSLISQQLKNPPEIVMDLGNNPAYREIPCGSTHGFGTATSLAKLFGILANDGVHKGKQLLSKAAIDRLMEPLSVGWDRVLRMDITYGRGVTLRDVHPRGYMFGTPGAGGQMGYADPQHKLGISFLTNYQSLFSIGDDPRYLELERSIYRCAQELSGTYKEESADNCMSEECGQS